MLHILGELLTYLIVLAQLLLPLRPRQEKVSNKGCDAGALANHRHFVGHRSFLSQIKLFLMFHNSVTWTQISKLNPSK